MGSSNLPLDLGGSHADRLRLIGSLVRTQTVCTGPLVEQECASLAD